MFDDKAKIFGSEVEKNYQAILELQQAAEIVDYLEKCVDTPVGKEYFVPLDYQWENTAFAIEVKRYHQWFILQGIKDKTLRSTLTDQDKRFKKNFQRFNDFYVMAMDSPQETWVKSRYAINLYTYPPAEEYKLSLKDKLFGGRKIKEQAQSINSGDGLPYQWKKVGVTPLRRRPQLILVDVLTELEAPLLSGQESAIK